MERELLKTTFFKGSERFALLRNFARKRMHMAKRLNGVRADSVGIGLKGGPKMTIPAENIERRPRSTAQREAYGGVEPCPPTRTAPEMHPEMHLFQGQHRTRKRTRKCTRKCTFRGENRTFRGENRT